MYLSFTKQSDGRYALAFNRDVLDLIGIDPASPVEVTTDGARLVIHGARLAASATKAGTTASSATTSPSSSAAKTYTPGMSCLDACHKYLVEVGGSHHAREITEAIIKKGYWTTKGATPDATAAALMTTEINRRPESSRFMKTGPNIFAAR